MALPVGTIIRGRYLVQGQLSNGGFGDVYLVRDQYITWQRSNLFVLKEVINPGKHQLYQITLDGMALRLLQHQALPHVYNVLSDNKYDRVFVQMEYIEGPNLEMLRLRQPEKRFSFPQVMTIMTPIMDAVAYLHSQRPPIIHQDIKPANIIVSSTRDKVTLVDFGVDKRYNLVSTATAVRHSLTPYEAPEQYIGGTSTRSDIYGLGATFYTLLTGIVPDDALYREGWNIDPLEPVNLTVPAISKFVAEAIHRAMSLDSNDRFPTVQQFEQALKAADPTRTSGPSPKLKLRLILEELDLPTKADSVEQGSLGPLIPPIAAAQSRTDLVEEKSSEPFIVPSLPTDQRPPEPEVVPSASVEQEPSEPEVVPSASVEQESSEPEILPSVSVEQEPPIAYDVSPETIEEQLAQSEVVPSASRDQELPIPYEAPSDAIDQQPLTADSIPSAPTQSPVIPEEAEEIPAAESMIVHSHTVRSSKLRIILLVSVALLIGTSLGVVFLSFLVNPGSRSATPTSVVLHKTTLQSSPRPAMTSTPIPSSTTFANINGSYKGTIYSILANVTTTMSLARIQQSQGNISGYITGLQVSGHLIGIINASRHIQFTVMNSAGHPILSFDGAMQSDGNLSGSYCSLDQKRQCSGDYGIWSVGPASASQISFFEEQGAISGYSSHWVHYI
jgi:serine/threonine protein kinase